MRSGDPSNLPNPFAVDLATPRRGAKRAVLSTLKFLLIVILGLAAVVVVGTQSRRWLLHRLTADMETLDGPRKQQRLVQISELGAIGIPTLVRALGDPEEAVARTAHDLLQDAQNAWTVLDPTDSLEHHRLMVQAMRNTASQLPADRGRWAASLLQQTVLETSDRDDAAAQQVHSLASETMSRLGVSRPIVSAGQTAALSAAEPTPDALTPVTVAANRVIRVGSSEADPLPVNARELDSWTSWPPGEPAPVSGPAGTREASPDVQMESVSHRSDSPSTAKLDPTATSDSSSHTGSDPSGDSEPDTSDYTEASASGNVQAQPSIYRSSTYRLRPVQSTAEVSLQAFRHKNTGEPEGAGGQPTTHLVDSPMATYDTRSVIHWLGHTDPQLCKAAELELTRRGFDQQQLSIAAQIATGDLQTRLELVDTIARSQSLDPRPWLLMLLDDDNRDVKLRVISVLATMQAPDITRQLQQRLAAERDPTVAARIRRVLDLR